MIINYNNIKVVYDVLDQKYYFIYGNTSLSFHTKVLLYIYLTIESITTSKPLFVKGLLIANYHRLKYRAFFVLKSKFACF